MATNRKDTKAQRADELSKIVIGAAIEVHRSLGTGLLKSAYQPCLCHGLTLRGVAFRQEVELPVDFKGIHLDCGYRVDVLIEQVLVIELKAVEKLLPIHEGQLLTYLKLLGCHVGLLLNFNVPVLRDGIKRMVCDYPHSPQ